MTAVNAPTALQAYEIIDGSVVVDNTYNFASYITGVTVPGVYSGSIVFTISGN